MTNLTNKIAIVTGASSGIGAGIVKELLKSGMKVVGLARRKAMVEELGKGYEGMLFALECDISKEQDILDAFAWTAKNVGSLDVLINNAGVSYLSPIPTALTAKYRQVLDTNVLGLALCTREALKAMNENNTVGFIININSVTGHCRIDAPGVSIYSASKYAVTAYTEATRFELAKSGSKIRITSISPGVVESEMSQDFLAVCPYIKSQDIANAVKYILTQPENVNIAELTIRPTGELF